MNPYYVSPQYGNGLTLQQQQSPYSSSVAFFVSPPPAAVGIPTVSTPIPSISPGSLFIRLFTETLHEGERGREGSRLYLYISVYTYKYSVSYMRKCRHFVRSFVRRHSIMFLTYDITYDTSLRTLSYFALVLTKDPTALPLRTLTISYYPSPSSHQKNRRAS